RRFLANEYSFLSRNTMLQSGGFSPDKWQAFADLGLMAAMLPEESGGLGGTGVDIAVILEEFGRYLVLEPFNWGAVVSGQLLLALENPERRREQIDTFIAGKQIMAVAALESESGYDFGVSKTTAAMEPAGYRLNGVKTLVANGA